MLDALARHALQFRIGESIALNGAQVFVRHIGAGDAFVVTGNRDGDSVLHIRGQGMVFAADAKDLIVGGQIDFDHDIARGHFLQEADGILLEHHG